VLKFGPAIARRLCPRRSAEAVRHRIRALIHGEASDDTLSDERLIELLQREGVGIARRTVAKYRKGMRIPSSDQRRRDKRRALGPMRRHSGTG
jgi:RNA polymerase sigma-54 factor